MMERDAHETLLNELNSPDLEHTRRTEILSELRNDYSTVHLTHEEITKQNETFERHNNDLVKANSILFRQVGETETEKPEETVQKEFSETVTITELERNVQ